MNYPDFDTDTAHSARVYDYILGGKDNFAADRAAAQSLVENLPSAPVSMRANRQFMTRVARHLAAERGLYQFLDIGTGLPTSPNLHEVVQSVNSRARVIYVDNDPIVLVHARALLTSSPEGKTAYIDADLRQVESILSSPKLRDTLDLDQPVALSLIAILHFIDDDEEIRRILSTLLAALVPGSALALSVVAADNNPEVAGANDALREHGVDTNSFTRQQVEVLFDGLDLLDPGVVLVHQWHPDQEARGIPDEHVNVYGGVAIKP